jgi:selenocysteine-specific elongation factor
LQALIAANRPQTLVALMDATGFDAALITAALQSIDGKALPLTVDRWIAVDALTHWLDRLTRILAGYHKAEPLRSGMRPESLRGQLSLEAVDFTALLHHANDHGIIRLLHGDIVALPDHQPQPSKAQRVSIDKLLALFAAQPYSPPSVKEALAVVGDQVYSALVENGDLIQLSAEVVFTPAIFTQLIVTTRQFLETEGRVNVRLLRDHFNTSRKYALAVLEHLNALGITKRDGDDHVLASGKWEKIKLA